MVNLTVMLLVVICMLNCVSAGYEEQLKIEPLTTGLIHAHFKFMTTVEHHDLADGHYAIFPKSLGEILVKYNVQELELSLTQGIWRYFQWGIPAEGAANPSGASVLAVFKTSSTDVDKDWRDLVNSLSGLICASLNFIDSKVTTIPQYTFRPRGAYSKQNKFTNSMMRYANLPQENLCTENLTPWKKLLPCVGKAGLSSLLEAKPLFDSNYHSLSLSVRPVCKDEGCTSVTVNLLQSLSVVVNNDKQGRKQSEFTLKSLFSKPISQPCHIADRSTVIVKRPKHLPYALTLDPAIQPTTDSNGATVYAYDVVENLNVKASFAGQLGYRTPQAPVIHAHRYLSGYGQEYGAIVCEITNNEEENLQIVYTEYIPWFLRVYLHTLTVTSDDTTITPAKVSYSPGLERKKPYLFELLLTIPANSTTVIRFSVEKLFLKWTEYPPDANLGFYIPSAIITAVLPDAPEDACIQVMKEGYGVVRLYTEKMLVLLPTPDFSMPYNVICLACTVVALAFGSFHNLTTKTLIRDNEKKPTFLQKVINGIKKVLGFKAADVNEELSNSAEVDDTVKVDEDDGLEEEGAGDEKEDETEGIEKREKAE